MRLSRCQSAKAFIDFQSLDLAGSGLCSFWTSAARCCVSHYVACATHPATVTTPLRVVNLWLRWA